MKYWKIILDGGKHVAEWGDVVALFCPPLKVLSQPDASPAFRTWGKERLTLLLLVQLWMPPWKVTGAQPQCCSPAVVSGRESLRLLELPCLCRLMALIPEFLQLDFRVKGKGPMERRVYGFLYSKEEMLPVVEAHDDSFTPVRRRMWKLRDRDSAPSTGSARSLAQDSHSHI